MRSTPYETKKIQLNQSEPSQEASPHFQKRHGKPRVLRCSSLQRSICNTSCCNSYLGSTKLMKIIWLVVSTQLNNISQNGNLPQIGVKIKKYLSCHHLVIVFPRSNNWGENTTLEEISAVVPHLNTLRFGGDYTPLAHHLTFR